MPSRPKAPETPALLDVPEPVVEEPVTENATVATVRLYPTHTAYVPDEPATERDVTPKEAKRLLAYQPPAFTTEPPEAKDDLPEAITPPEPQE